MQFVKRVTTSDELERLLKSTPGFLGVFSRDTIPNVNWDKRFSFIMNLNRMGESGSHWTAVYHDGKDEKTVDYFDSMTSS